MVQRFILSKNFLTTSLEKYLCYALFRFTHQGREMFQFKVLLHTSEEFENTILFLRLDLLSTPIRHENGAFRKYS